MFFIPINRIFKTLENRINQFIIRQRGEKLPEYKNAKFLTFGTTKPIVKARKIWGLKEGEHAIIEMPKKEWEAKQYFKIKKLKQTRNGVIIELKKFYSKSPAEDVKRLVFYPKLEDIKLFAISSGSMILDGPSEGLKGSVGTLA